MLRRTQPSVLVHMSRVLDNSFRENPAVLLNTESTFASKQRKVWISIGTLALLRVGDIWRDGQLELAPDYELENFLDLKICSESSVLVKAGLNLEEQGFLLPRAEHPWHMECTQSYCLMIELPQNRRLIVPCIELIRFYFGSSSNLLTKLFLPPLVREALYTKPHFDKTNGRLTLQLAAGISGASAADIGRMHLEPHAWRVAVHVGTSLLKRSISSQGVYPQAYFPFEGATNVCASGKWLSFQDAPKATFVVFSLRSCTHSFPFRSLRYSKNDTDLNSARKKSIGQNRSIPQIVRKSADDSPDQQLIENDPSNTLTKKTQPSWGSPRFPDLIRKAIWKDRLLIEPPLDKIFDSRQPNDVQHSAVGNTGSSRRARPVDFEIRARQKAEFPPPEFLRGVVEELEALDNFSIHLLTDSYEDAWTIPITVLVSDDGEIDSRLFVVEGHNQLRERRMAIFVVNSKSESVQIAVIESTPVHVKLYLPSEKNNMDITETLTCAAADFLSRPEPKTEDILFLIRWVFDVPSAI